MVFAFAGDSTITYKGVVFWPSVLLRNRFFKIGQIVSIACIFVPTQKKVKF